MHYIGSWGNAVPDRLAPTLKGRLASHAHYLKEGGFFVEKVRNVAQFKPSSLVIMLVPVFIVISIQITMTCIVMGKCYIKTGIHNKNGASVSSRSAFVTSIM